MNPNNYATLEAAQRLLDAGIVLETDFCSDLWGDPNKIIPWYSGVEPGHPDFVPRPSMAEVWREYREHVPDYQNRGKLWNALREEKVVDALIDLLIWLTAQKEAQDGDTKRT
jgi:hypothetical protein